MENRITNKLLVFSQSTGIYLLILVCLFVCSYTYGSVNKKVILFEKHKILPVIMSQNNQTRILKDAENDLQNYLYRITGESCAITNKSKTIRFPIYIGRISQNKYLARKAPKWKPGIDGYVLDITDNGIHIYGNSDEGTAYGIYDLLECVGVRWLFPGKYGEVVPENKNVISLSVGKAIEKPVFAIREVDSAWSKGLRPWRRRSRNNYSGFGGHNGLGLWKYRHEHPEWFAEINGVRQVKLDNPADFKVCYANDDMVKQAIKNVLAAIGNIEKNGNPGNYFIYSVSPTDGGGFCKCKKCLAMGSVSDRVQGFVNKIADAVAKEYPDMMVGYYGAYSEHYMPPTIKARSNVVVFITTWAKNLTKSIESTENTAFRSKVEAFHKMCPKLAIRDYEFLDCWWEKGPYSLIAVHNKDYKWYYEHGIIGILTECSDYWEGGAQSNYVMVRLWWNPYADVEAIKKDYVEHAYGKAFVPMWRFHELINREQAFIDDATIIKLRHDLEDAAKLAERKDVKKRIDLLRIHYLMLAACSDIDMGKVDRKLFITAFRAGLTDIDAWSATTLKRIIMPQIYKAIQELPGNEYMLKVKYPYTTSEKTILDAMASVGLKPYTDKELSDVLANMKLPEEQSPLSQWHSSDNRSLVPLFENKHEFNEDINFYLRYLFHRFLIYVKPNEVIEISSDKKQNKAVSFVYKILSPELTKVAAGEFFADKPLRYTAGSGGIYTVDIQVKGNYSSLKIKNQYAVVQASSAQQKIHPIGGMRNHYFYVPKGTTGFALIIKGDKGEPYSFKIWDSPDAGDENLLIPKKLYKNTSFMEHRIKVPEGADGKVWKLWLSGEDMELFIKGIPPFISNAPCRLLRKNL